MYWNTDDNVQQDGVCNSTLTQVQLLKFHYSAAAQVNGNSQFLCDAYCWAEVFRDIVNFWQTYFGNASTQTVHFVYTGLKPAFVMNKSY